MNAYLRGQRLAVESYHEATFIVAKELKLFEGKETLSTQLNQLEQVSNNIFNQYMAAQERAGPVRDTKLIL